jgi:hypothetical protein
VSHDSCAFAAIGDNGMSSRAPRHRSWSSGSCSGRDLAPRVEKVSRSNGPSHRKSYDGSATDATSLW